MTYNEFIAAWEHLGFNQQADIYCKVMRAECGDCKDIWQPLTEEFFHKWFSTYKEVITAWDNGDAYGSDEYIRINGYGNIETANYIDVADYATDHYLERIYHHPEIWEEQITEVYNIYCTK